MNFAYYTLRILGHMNQVVSTFFPAANSPRKDATSRSPPLLGLKLGVKYKTRSQNLLSPYMLHLIIPSCLIDLSSWTAS